MTGPAMNRVQIARTVLKLGGAALDQCPPGHALWASIAAAARTSHSDLIVVHGGGSLANQRLSELGRSATKIDGLRVTPDADLGIVVGSLAGEANAAVLSRLIAAADDPGAFVGLSLSPAVLGGVASHPNADLGRVGVVGDHAVAGPALKAVLTAGVTPVVASIAVDATGEVLNINADDAAVGLARAAGASRIVMLSDVPGVLDADGRLIDQLDAAEAERLIDTGVITGGMTAKVRAAVDAAAACGGEALIAGWADAEGVIRALSTNRPKDGPIDGLGSGFRGGGTVVTAATRVKEAAR